LPSAPNLKQVQGMTKPTGKKADSPIPPRRHAGTEALIDIAMRDYLAVRDDMWGLRRLSTSIFTGVIAAVAVALSAIVFIADKGFGSPALSLAFLAAALLLEFTGIVLIGIDGSFKIVEDANRRQARDLRRLLKQASATPLPSSTLRFQDRADDVGSRRQWLIWLPSYGAWGMEGLVLPFLAVNSIVASILVAYSNNGGLSTADSLMLAIDIVVGLVLAHIVLLNLQLPRRLKARGSRPKAKRIARHPRRAAHGR
jgi:hypothetical protein